jgi:hypothetical protein
VFAKVFSQIFDSSISANYLTRLVFEDMLVLADSDGVVDMTADALARRTNVPVEIVQRGIEELSQPDPESRTPDEDGRRIVLLDSHRTWGWRIVNYGHYRGIRNEETRREYMRTYMQRRRNSEGQSVNSCKQDVNSVNSCKPQLAQEEEEEDLKNYAPSAPSLSTPSGEKKASRKDRGGDVERVYLAYPLRKGASEARKAIGKAIDKVKARGESDPAGFLIGKIQAWEASRARDRAAGRFVPEIPYPAKWFNQDRFDDELAHTSALAPATKPMILAMTRHDEILAGVRR